LGGLEIDKVSVIIPGRNEIYFQQTIDSCLKSAVEDIEVIAVVDGYKPNPPLVARDSRVKIIQPETSIGQRAGYNLGVKNSTGKYVMKIDAHAIVSPGFDKVLKSNCPPKTTVLPEMRRLDVKKWEHKSRGKTHFMYFGLDVFCHYWQAYRKRPEAQVEYPEVLTGQGSCWFTTREWNDYIGLLDESLGSWGKVGIEVSLKTWLCGGTQIVNKKAWQAHWFRAGEGRFPYPLSGRQVGRARDFTWNNFFFKETGAFPNQVRPFRWLMEKFAPVPGWEAYMVDEYKSDRVIIYYTDSNLETTLAEAVRKNLKTAAGPIPIISVSQKPINFGKSICVGDKPRSLKSMYEQILVGAEAAPKGSTIYLCEHDVFYHPSQFAKIPRDKRAFYFNQNRYYWWVGEDVFYKAGQRSRAWSQAVVSREYLLAKMRILVNNWDELNIRRHNWESERPNIDVRNGQNLTGDSRGKARIRKGKGKNKDTVRQVKNIGGWGSVHHMQSTIKYKGTMRWDIIQGLIDMYKYKSYLEIGIDKGANWKRIKCDLKHGMDPNGGGTHKMTSDEFFRRFYDTYDLIFIDGLHHADQVEKDFDNALKHLKPNGTIVMHDCSPRNEDEQRVPWDGKQRIWTGDAWKAFVKNRTRSDLEMYVVNTNNGIGIIRPGKQEPITINGDLDYHTFSTNQHNWLNLKSVTWHRKHERALSK